MLTPKSLRMSGSSGVRMLVARLTGKGDAASRNEPREIDTRPGAGRSWAIAALTVPRPARRSSVLRAQGRRDVRDTQLVRREHQLAARCERTEHELSDAARVKSRVDARLRERSESRAVEAGGADHLFQCVAEDL